MIELTRGGLLVDAGSSQSLAEGFYRLWKSPEERTELGRSGYEGVRQHYNIQRSADRMLQVYERSMC
jgi:glycosyltransferase involved in cell wall biosynthesis